MKPFDRITHRFAAAFVAALLVLGGCAPDDPSAPTYVASGSQKGRVVALGNSLTAGLINDALFAEGQRIGFANLVSLQVTGEEIVMPLIASPGVATTPDLVTIPGTPIPRGQAYVTAQGEIAYRPIPGADPVALLLNSTEPGPYENLGVPGSFAVDVLNANSGLVPALTLAVRPGNLFFDFILRNGSLPGPPISTQISQLEARIDRGIPPTELLLVWVGSNDVLIGALSGNPQVAPDGQTTFGAVTAPSTFETHMDAILDRVDDMSVLQVAVLNIPNVTAIPYVTAVRALIEQGLAQQGVTWAQFRADLRTEETEVEYVLLDSRTETDLFLLDGNLNPEYLNSQGGTSTLASEYTLTASELALLSGVVDDYNAYIASAVGRIDRDWALVDIESALDGLSSDPELNAGYALVPTPTGLVQNPDTAFGLDGVHPSEKGYARIANVVLAAVNEHYMTDHPFVDESSVQNRLGFEEFNGASARTIRMAEGHADIFGSISASPSRR